MTWPAVIALALGTYALRAAGPLLLAGRHIPDRLREAMTLVAVSLLAALIAISTVVTDEQLDLDPRIVGVAVGGVAAVLRAPFVVVVVLAAAVTAILRLFV